MPLILVDSAGDYEASLKQELSSIKEKLGIDAIVFGSLYAEEDRKWNEDIAFKTGLESLFPVWIEEKDAANLLEEFISLGFRSVVCRASVQYFDPTWAGRTLDWSFLEDIKRTESCAMGEHGEYHTFVLDGPIFNQAIEITQSEVVLNSGLWSLDIQACQLQNNREI